MKKEIYISLFLLPLYILASHFLIFDAVAQEKEEEVKEVDNYIQKFRDKLVVGLSLNNNLFVYDILDGEKEIFITPNTPLRTNIAVSYDFLRFQYGFSNLFNDVNASKYGKTKDFFIKLNIFIKSFRQIFSIHSIQGMHLSNMGAIYEDYLEGQPKEQYNSMYMYSIKGQSSYSFNPNFSHKAIDLNNEWQKISSFSFTPYFIYSYNRITNLPQHLPVSLPVSLENIDFNFQPRAYFSLVVKQNLFFTTMVYPNLGYRYSVRDLQDKVSGNLSKQYKNIILLGTGFRLQLGYNSHYFFGGTSLAFDLIVSDNKNILFIESNEFFSLYFGCRFTAPKLLKTIIDKAKLMIDVGNQ